MTQLHALMYCCIGFLVLIAVLRAIAFARGRKIPWYQPAWQRVDAFADDRLNKIQNRLNLASLVMIFPAILSFAFLGVDSNAGLWIAGAIVWLPLIARGVFFEANYAFAELAVPTDTPAAAEHLPTSANL